jgi:ribosome biogenesis GTPase / thiamine phosphate phosphatase
MINSEQEFLSLFGWDDFFESQKTENDSYNLKPARVICEERNLYQVQIDTDKAILAAVSGKLQFNAATRADYPAVGDWVLISNDPEADRAIIHSICPRKMVIQRKQVGSSADIQILSTNVDTVFITTSANDDLNFKRIERYLSIAWDSKATPVILLTKADVCVDDIENILEKTKNEFPAVAVFALSQNNFEQADFFSEYLKKGTTSVFIGSSGVGKSTLVNYLIGEDVAKTQSIREDDSKGRHTTTARSLYVSRYGGLIIDTPGMRELQLSDHTEGLKAQFAEIDELINLCKFSDCKHLTEPGCQILKALENESLSLDHWNSYQKLANEVRHGLRKQNRAIAAEDRRVWKKLTTDARERGLHKKKGF